MLKNMSASLINSERIETTVDKAKYLRPYFEKLVTKAIRANASGDKIVKFNTVLILKSKINSNDSVKKLMTEIAPSFEKRNGGYTRIIKTRNRDGDNAQMAFIELVKESKK